MEKMIAYCGLDCGSCPAYLATIQDDDKMREETAANWSKEFKAEIKPTDINCLGCPSDEGPVFNYCMTCNIRKCSREKELENCAHCEDYGCEELENFLNMVPEARKRLEGVRYK